MKLSEYKYDLPKSLIAINPPMKRGTSRLLVLNRKTGKILDKKYSDLPEFLCAGDVLVLNDTRVIKARLKVLNKNGDVRELLILEKHSFDSNWYRHRVMYRHKIKSDEQLRIGDVIITIEDVSDDGTAIVRCETDLLELADEYGEVPLPPYMHRDANTIDVTRYQTVWAKEKGSVAAPTASLNMTDDILTTLNNTGITVVYLTLHVGLGTFLPIRTEKIENHHMHQEYFEIPKVTVKAIQQAKLEGMRVIALGTTVARTLEYANKALMKPPLNISGEADIFIYPGYEFKTIDALITNYHAPKSTVLMLTTAFAGWDKLLPAYNHAITEKYQFLSYGDSMLIQ